MDLSALELHSDEVADYLQSMLRTMREALVVLDHNLLVKTANPAFYSLFGIQVSESADRTSRNLADRLWNLPQLRDLLGRVLEQDSSFQDVEVTYDFPGAGRKTMLLNARRLCHPARPEEVSILLVIQDITDLKQTRSELLLLQQELEERVRRRTAELTAANAELEAFAYAVSHDLRAPLRALAGFSQALVEDCADTVSEEGREYIRRVQQGADHMSELIDDLLTLSRVTRREIRYDRVDLTALAHVVFEELRMGEPGRNVSLSVEEGLVAEGDHTLLLTLLRNLLGNAWKYTRSREDARIRFEAIREGEQTVYRVQDNGVGFEMEYVGKLFRPFQRLHTAFDFEGNGIGLATASRIIKRHGGSIRAEGKVGEGATFFFTLPGSAAAETLR